ncbi:hypothetical protein P344_07125 [Spiroplasma mirum ATCC 29335]|uniref:Uncharacterized protein n=2 Tax=Spiroplasma mirum TaxID=2144 RepID=W0GMU1_9MOLU|nr:hypothetical protein [Spiroplasma mirum]AHF61565.1 hypothetical protein SMM_1198 [Spiroplasma mirum ATCC 29335]AHI58721.1 hypothetical protein P344_07125 [Spiroplasma mirum ATCC 29335]AKM53598.1 hypothetical protein SATRI_v1c12660 [Spiroplasma atrichopogonis]
MYNINEDSNFKSISKEIIIKKLIDQHFLQLQFERTADKFLKIAKINSDIIETKIEWGACMTTQLGHYWQDYKK